MVQKKCRRFDQAITKCGNCVVQGTINAQEMARFNAWLNDGKSHDLTHWLDAIMVSDAISKTVQMMEAMLADADEHYQNMPEFMRQVISPIQKLIYSVRIKALTF